MDVEDYTRQVKPRKNGSQLLPFKKEIGDLKRMGYSDELIREWLAQNGITVSRENVRKFIKRHLHELNTATPSAQENGTTSAPGVGQVPQLAEQTASGASSAGRKESPAKRIQRLAREQRNEAEQTHFKHDKTGNNHWE